MRARLTIYTEDKSSLFFNTMCELELSKDRAQIRFAVSDEDKESKIVLGINRKKIIVLRTIIYENSDEETPQEEDIFLLSKEKNEPSKAVIAFGDVELFFSAENYKAKIGKTTVEVELNCMLALGESKTDMHRIYLKCVSSEENPQ